MVKLHVGDSTVMPRSGVKRAICLTDLGSSLYWHGSGKLLNHSKPLIPHLCNGDNTTALTGLSGGLTEILCVIHLAQCLANDTLQVKGEYQCH